MTNGETEWLTDQQHERHVWAALSAAIASIVLHLALVYWVSQLPFGLRVLDQERMASRQDPRRMRVESVLDENSGESGVSAGNLADSIQAFASSEQLAEQLQELGLQPDAVAIEPSAVGETLNITETKNTVEPAAVVEAEAWQPRQEILAIQDQVVRDEFSALERQLIPTIDRVPRAADVVLPIESIMAAHTKPDIKVDIVALLPSETPTPGGAQSAVLPPTEREGAVGEAVAPIEEPKGESGGALFEEVQAEVTDIQPIEDFLKAKVSLYSPLFDRKYTYFKLEINRASEDVLPVIPKDIVLVQDSSTSMTEQRLYFCRNGLLRCLNLIGPEDRFNVMSFQEKARLCFPDWKQNSSEARLKAQPFIEGLRSGGNTDILASLQSLFRLQRQSGRPLTVFLITDGRSTTGLTDSSQIIGRFTKQNDGALSMYTLGTINTANAYLLDLMSYCNRGETVSVRNGRWSIPDAMEAVMKDVSRPVMSDVQFRLSGESPTEVYPMQTSNLYLDRPLVLYGRCPRQEERLVFQAVGQAAEARCDMIFDLNMEWALQTKDKTLRKEWARQKVYHLLGEHARAPQAVTVEAIRQTAREYDVDIPYAEDIGM
ncbi:MAG: VWA domain-containing protein [Kiritimatiellae bacterium]|nr:VWA domain-containing protein [Kiritimatiellia bacterium]